MNLFNITVHSHSFTLLEALSADYYILQIYPNNMTY